MKRWLLLPFLCVLSVVAGLAFLSGSEQGGRLLVRMAEGVSGGSLAVDAVSGRLVDVWRLDGVRIRTVDLELSVQAVEVRWQPLALLRKEVRMSRVIGRGVELMIRGEAEDSSPFALPGLALPVDVVLERVELTEFLIHDDTGFAMPLIDHLSGRLAGARQRVLLQDGEMRLMGVVVRGEGNMELTGSWPVDLRGGLRVAADADRGVPAVVADFVARGVLTDPVVQVDLIEPIQTRVGLVFTELFGDTRWQAETVVPVIGGRDVLAWWEPSTDQEASHPDLRFTDVHVRASGTMDEYEGTLRTAGAWTPWPARPHLAMLPAMEIAGEFTGDDQGLQVQSLVVKLPEGELAAGGMVSWQDDLHWLVELSARQVGIATYLPGWTGWMDAELHMGGRLRGDVLSGEIELAALDGELLGHPLSGRAQVRMDEHGVRVEELLLQSGDSRLEIAGEIGDRMAFEIRGEVTSLGHFQPDADGSLSFRGGVAGSREAPEFSFTLEAAGVSSHGLAARSLNGSGKGVFSSQGAVDLEVTAGDLRLGPTPFSRVTVGVTGVMAAHQLRATLSGPTVDGEILLAGALDLGETRAWRGEVRDLLMKLDPLGKWRLREPASLRVDDQGVALAPACLVQGAAVVCVEGDWQGFGDGSWRLHGNVDSLASDLLHRWHLTPYPMIGELTGLIRLQGEAARLVRGEAEVRAAELQVVVHDEDGKQQRLRWTDTLLRMDLADSRLTAMARSRFQDGSAIDAAVEIDGFSDLSSSWAGLPLRGEIGLDVRDLAPLSFLAPDMIQPTGSMKGAFTLSGRVGSPILSGELRQTEGEIFVPAAGIHLEELSLQMAMTSQGEGMEVTLSVDSGSGHLRIAGNVARGEEGWQADVGVSGRRFELARLTEYEVVVDPDLRLVVDGGAARVSGKVLVPRAVIAVSRVDGSISASDDVVFVDDRNGGRKTLPLSGTVTVELGKDVHVDSFDLKGRLEGSVMVAIQPGSPLTGRGNLTVHDGIYVARNRALDISRGQFSFQGGSLDNPNINMLIQKRNTRSTVGVQVSGTLEDMELKLFSDPPMAEGEILTALLSGRPYSGDRDLVSGSAKETTGGDVLGEVLTVFETGGGLVDNIYVESGAGATDVSLIVGKELFKDLYISYGYDPFKAAGIFRARYDLWRRFSVETEIGADQTGADLLWSIEK